MVCDVRFHFFLTKQSFFMNDFDTHLLPDFKKKKQLQQGKNLTILNCVLPHDTASYLYNTQKLNKNVELH